MRTYVRLGFLVAVATAMLFASAGIGAAPSATERVSVDSAGNPGNDHSHSPAISGDGRYVAFSSDASNLVADDTNDAWDVFVHDRQTGITEQVSVDSAGVQGNAQSWSPVISGDGRYVAFLSHASNLVPGDTNDNQDVFVHDRQTNVTTRVSVDSAGNPGNGHSHSPAISGDGRYVAFSSDASNLVPGDTNTSLQRSVAGTCGDVFIHDRQTGVTERVSVDSAGNQGDDRSGSPATSGDGRYVAFESNASNLVADDTNDAWDIFVHDRETGATTRVSVDSAGKQWNRWSRSPAISADGRYVALYSEFAGPMSCASPGYGPGEGHEGCSQVFVHDRHTGVTEQASSWGNGHSYSSAISGDGRYVAFDSYASDLVPDDTRDRDIFVHDRQTGVIEQVSVDSAGVQGNDTSGSPAISADGRYVAFSSDASNLVPEDTNDSQDVFVRDRGEAPTPMPTPAIHADFQCSAALAGTFVLRIDISGFPEGTFVDLFLFPEDFYLGGLRAVDGVMEIGGFVGSPFQPTPFTLSPGPHTITANVRDPAGEPNTTFEVFECRMHVCPSAGKWAISVWDGPSGTATANALATCADVFIDAAYWLDPTTQLWWRYFPNWLGISNLLTLDALQPIMIRGR